MLPRKNRSRLGSRGKSTTSWDHSYKAVSLTSTIFCCTANKILLLSIAGQAAALNVDASIFVGGLDAPSAANAICGAYALERVAICIAGAARTFTQPAVYLPMRRNLIDAFGGNATVFARIKVADDHADPRIRDIHVGAPDRIDAALAQALRHLGLSRREHLQIPTEVDECPACPYLSGFHTLPDPLPQPFTFEAHTQSTKYLRALCGQLANRGSCNDMIVTEEQRTGLKFDRVIFARPDFQFTLPLEPFCFWRDRNENARDWAYVLNRAAADKLLKVPRDRFYACDTTFRPGMTHENFFASFLPHNSKGSIKGTLVRQRQDSRNACHTWHIDFPCKDATYANPCVNVNNSAAALDQNDPIFWPTTGVKREACIYG